MKHYDHKKIEKKWQTDWAKKNIYAAKDGSKKSKFYALDMFPYPSGEGLHVGHPKGYIATDVVSRMKRMQGYNVLHPMGFDAFGLPAENYAIKMKTNPQIAVAKNVARYKKQLKILGFDYDWNREINTTDPKYYKWTQWIFLQMLQKGLAYESYEPINWCPSCKTGLANEDVEDGRCERCGTPVEKKPMRQWVLKITDYADRLLSDLEYLDWPEHIKESQRNWIGRSEGAEIDFAIKNQTEKIKVFTTRPDTLFGVTYVVLSPEHELVNKLLKIVENEKEVVKYVAEARIKTEIERTDAKKEKTGVELKGVKVVNPVNGEEVPVFVADYVLAGYGTGAVMAVPAHDDRDFEFAKKFKLPIKYVIEPKFIGVKGDGVVLPGLPFVKRNAVCVIVRNPKDDTYMCVSWKGISMHGLVTGGIEDGEDIVIAARREALEETGYKNLRFVKISPIAINTFFYHRVKKENRHAHFQFVFFDLENEEREKVDEKEASLHEILWKKKNELKNFFTVFEGEFLLELLNKGDFAFVDEGILANSDKFSGKDSAEIMKEITAFASGKWVTKYKLKDWVFSRQRYWGEPIPVFHDGNKIVPVALKDLPVVLPKVKYYEPTGTGESPLADIAKWVNVKASNEKKYFIFDFDGVLGDTWNAAIKARVKMGNVATEKEAITEFLKYFNATPDHTRNSERTPEKIRLDNEYVNVLGIEIAKQNPSLFMEFVREVKKYKNAKCAVVSSGSNKYVLPPLKKSGMKFSHILSWEDDHSKEEKIEKICADWGVSVKDIYYFTDTKADVYELENLLDRSKIIGCAWGYLGYERLNEVLSDDQILKDFKDIHRVIGAQHILKRETNTMPQWAGSSWYYLRYMDPKDSKHLVDPKKEKYWNEVDFYVGGAEHATRHLIYARFWHKFLYDIGVVSTLEPFKKLQSVGLIMGEDGKKMSKRFGNVINPDEIVETYGADTLRVYEMFMGPFDQMISWSTDGMIGSRRFIERVWKSQEKVAGKVPAGSLVRPPERAKTTRLPVGTFPALLNKTIKKVTEDIAGMHFNTAVSSLMILQNAFDKEPTVSRADFETYLKLLAPFAPHVAEEIWHSLGNKKSVHVSDWPVWDENLVKDANVKIAVQINGKVRAVIEIAADADQSAATAAAVAAPETGKWLSGKTPSKIIYVKGKIINFIVPA